MISKETCDEYLPTIGIECHVQLATKTKLFSSVDNDAREAEPNSKISARDYALPGMLPYLNRQAVVLAVRAAKALNSDVAKTSRFDRKHYFYPDLPGGYQVSQMYNPIILAGHVELPNGEKIRIHHAHLEEDAGKLTHHSDYSLIDLNRAGTPLIEIVSEPDMHSATDAKSYAQELWQLMTYADVTFGNLYYGNMRFDVNVSVAPVGNKKLGTRVEVKNLNSFRMIERAVEHEIDRQIGLIEKGVKVTQETRGWDDAKGKTTAQRSKEDAQDYRYMPDPDVPPIVLTDEQIKGMQKNMPILPPEYRAKFAVLGVDGSVINAVLADQKMAEKLAQVLENSDADTARRVANWFASATNVSDDKQHYVSFVMGIGDVTNDFKKLGVDIVKKNDKNYFSVKFPVEKVAEYEKMIIEKLQPGFWNEYVGEEVVFIFKSKTGEIRRIVWSKDNDDELLKLCNEYAGADFKSISDMLNNNEFYEKSGLLCPADNDNAKLPSTKNLIKLSRMTGESKLSSTAAKEIFTEMLSKDADPEKIAEAKNLLQVSDTNEIEKIVEKVLASDEAAKAVVDIKAGNDKAIGFLIGLVMKESKGQANPGIVNKIIKEKLM